MHHLTCIAVLFSLWAPQRCFSACWAQGFGWSAGSLLMKLDVSKRFLDSSDAARYRRRMRWNMRRYRRRIAEKRRSRRAKRQRITDERTSRRTKQLPCCGRERRYCRCAWEVEHMMNDIALKKLADQAHQRNLLTKMDPRDMSFILRALH